MRLPTVLSIEATTLFTIYFIVLSHFITYTTSSSSSTTKRSNNIKHKKLNPSLPYNQFPTRKSHEAAVVEWGNSAIISAIDAAVASFGQQTSRGAFFEAETAPVLADPIDGRGGREDIPPDQDSVVGVAYPGLFYNKEDILGNMVVMTNDAGMSGVAMARMAVESGAAALMIVNVDPNSPDSIYSLKPLSEDEATYAEEHIDIPVIMVSLASGNLITSATVQDDMAEEDIVNNGMPERIRLYACGDRPFFEDLSSQNPILYMVHNLLSDDECNMLIQAAQGKFNTVDDTKSNILEHILSPTDGSGPKASKGNIQQMMLWRGQLNPHTGKQIEERIEQVTGYPQSTLSDWQIFKYEKGSKYEIQFDDHPLYPPVATITVFLNDLDDTVGGEVVYPNVKKSSPVMIKPKKGLAWVHHNIDFDRNKDYSATYGHLEFKGDVKYVARKFVYADPLPPSKRIVLPLFAIVAGGKLPRFLVTIYDLLTDKFGFEQGNLLFDKLVVVGPVLLLVLLGYLIGNHLLGKSGDVSDSEKGNSNSNTSGKGNNKKRQDKKND